MTATSPDSPTWSTGSSLPPKPWTRASRIPRNVTAWPSSPGSRVAAEMDARLALRTSRNGHGPSLVEPTRCGGRPKASASRGSARSRAANAWLREARTAAAVHAGATFLAQYLERSSPGRHASAPRPMPRGRGRGRAQCALGHPYAP